MLSLLMKISFRYWSRHHQRLFTLALAVVVGTGALCCTALLVRSEKAAMLDTYLGYIGDYDVIFYETDRDGYDTVSEMEGVTDVGYYSELGYGAALYGKRHYKIVSYGDVKSQEMYHMNCIRGSYPESPEEIALDAETARSLGIAPYPGEEIELKLYDLEKQELCQRTFVVSGIFQIYCDSTAGNYYRYPSGMKQEYSMPVMVVSNELNSLFPGDMVTGYAQAEVFSVIEEICQLDIKCSGMDCSMKRGMAYSHILGTDISIWRMYGNNSMESII